MRNGRPEDPSNSTGFHVVAFRPDGCQHGLNPHTFRRVCAVLSRRTFDQELSSTSGTNGPLTWGKFWNSVVNERRVRGVGHARLLRLPGRCSLAAFHSPLSCGTAFIPWPNGFPVFLETRLPLPLCRTSPSRTFAVGKPLGGKHPPKPRRLRDWPANKPPNRRQAAEIRATSRRSIPQGESHQQADGGAKIDARRLGFDLPNIGEIQPRPACNRGMAEPRQETSESRPNESGRLPSFNACSGKLCGFGFAFIAFGGFDFG